MSQRKEIRYQLDPPARGNFGGHGTCLIKDINFNGLNVVSGYSPPVGGKALVFIPAAGGQKPLPVEVLESQACCPDEEARRHLAEGIVFSIHCSISDPDEDTRGLIVSLLESNFSRLEPATV